MMTRDRVDLPHVGWVPPWAYIPSAYASPDHPDRQVYIPAIMAHPDYSGMPNAGQPAAQMDAAMFPDHHAATDNIPRVGNMPTNAVVRDMTDEFFRAQETRGSPAVPGAQGQIHTMGICHHPWTLTRSNLVRHSHRSSRFPSLRRLPTCDLRYGPSTSRSKPTCNSARIGRGGIRHRT